MALTNPFAPTGLVNPFEPSAKPAQVRAPEPPSGILDEIGTGLQKDVLETKALFRAGESAVAGALGFDDAQDKFLQQYDTLMKQADAHELTVGSIEEVNSPATFVRYAAGLLGENIPNIAAAFLTGGVGGILGKAVARNLVEKKAKDLLEKRARNWAIDHAVSAGVTASAAATNLPLGVGTVAGEQRSAGLEPNNAVSLGFGMIIGALGSAPVGLAFKAAGFFKPFENAIAKRVLEQGIGRRAAAGLAAGAATEGITEGMQEVVALAARDVVDENFDAFGPEAMSRIKNAIAGGIVIGGPIGAAAGALHTRDQNNEDVNVPVTVQLAQTEEHKAFFEKRFLGSKIREEIFPVSEEQFAETDAIPVSEDGTQIRKIADGVFSLENGLGGELDRGPLEQLTLGPLKVLYASPKDSSFGPALTPEPQPHGIQQVADVKNPAIFTATDEAGLIVEAELNGYLPAKSIETIRKRKNRLKSLTRALTSAGFDGIAQNGLITPIGSGQVQNINHDLFTIPADHNNILLSTISDLKASRELQDRSDANELKRLGVGLDTYGAIQKNFFSLLQFAQKNGHVEPLQRYTKAIFAGQAFRMQWIGRADAVDVEMKNLGKDRMRRWADYMFERDSDSQRVNRKLSAEEIARLQKKHKFDDDMLSLTESADLYFREVLTTMRDFAIAGARKRRELSEAQRVELLQKINDDFKSMVNRDFFTKARFGRHFVRVKMRNTGRIDQRVFKKGQTVTWEQFETRRQADTAIAQMRTDFKGTDVQFNQGLLTDAEVSLQGIPRSFIAGLEEKLDLTPEQKAHLQEVLLATAPENSFVKKFKRKKDIAGFSKDAARAFVDYAVRSANHLGRLKTNDAANEAIADLQNTISVIDELQGGDSTTRRQILEHVQRHKGDFQNPSTDFKTLQAGVFTWYLGFNPKSALVNLTQVPFITFPAMAARWNLELGRGGKLRNLQFANLDPRGDAAAVKHIARGYKQAAQYWRNPEKLDQGLREMLHQGQQDGWLAQTLGSDLISQQTGENLSRTLASPGAGKFIQRASHYSAYLFQGAEKLNRKVTAIAGYNMARELGKTQGESVAFAQEMVLDTQFEFSKINKAELLRGRAAIFFVFWQHMLSTLHFTGNNPGAPRFLMMLLMVAGVQGMPFADNIFDLLDFAGTKMKSALGFNNPLVDLRGDMREFVKELSLNPDLAMHGISRSSFGLTQVADMFGNPFPSVALDGSLSYGRPVPGTALLNTQSGQFSETFQRLASDAGGAALSVPIGIMQAIGDRNPDTVKRIERALPSALKSISKAYRLARDGGNVNNNGAVKFGSEIDITDPIGMAEVAFQAAGFNLTRVANSNEREYHLHQVASFYKATRTVLLKQIGYAKKINDREGLADAKRAIKRFNSRLDGLFRVYAISGKDITQSVKAQLRAKRKTEAGIIGARREQRLVNELRERF